jgi:hypothetical protein
MRDSANPIASRVALSPSRVNRKVLCAGYECRLDQAVKKKWPGFSCQRCLAFEPLQLDPSEWLLDSLACTALMYVTEFQSSFKQKARGNIVVRLQRTLSRGSVFGLS